MKILNWKMASHPLNYVVILLMLIIAGTAGHLLLSLFEVEPAGSNSYSNLPAGQTNVATSTSTPTAAPAGVSS